ncbi:unnamed protein product [Bursaphelenchus xylophilus]|uniref:(pine wood nematode) hypothetical protein n=1 Tax=Bursaphelenchus xylophilus TaxID=6326 RepID=A0A1I7S1I6_BURXY|nr:unnamed protein product [Bursaphelenchus xylophilus]CAG9081444.1 unnamed protein product [Bursaphelenchus xylophilus]
MKSEAFLPKGLFARPLRQYNETNWFSHVYQDVHWEPSQGKVDELRPVLPKGHEKVELPGRVVIPCNENCTTGGDVVECCRTHQWNDGVCIEEQQRDGRIERQAVCWQGEGLRIYSRDNTRPQHPATTNASAEAVNAENAGMPAATEAAIVEYIREVAFQGVLRPVRWEHSAAVTQLIQCVAAEQRRPEEQVIKDILQYSTSNATASPFIPVLNPECATLTDDEYVRALGKLIRTYGNNAEKVIKAFPQFKFIDHIADMIAERYLNYTNGRYGTEIPCDLFEMMGKENSDAMNYYVAFFLIGEEVVPGSVFKYIDPRKYVNPKLFEESEEEIELKDLIVRCEDKKESVYEVLRPVSKKHRAAVKEWIQCVAAMENRAEEQVIEEILEYRRSNATAFLSVLNSECAIQADDEYVRALGKWTSIYRSTYEKIKKVFQTTFVDIIADKIAEHYLNYTNGLYGTEIPCDLFEMMGKENSDVIKYFVTLILLGEELIPGSAFQSIDPRKYVNPKLFEESEEKIEMKDLIVKCEDKNESVFYEVLSPVSEKHRAAVKEWIQCVGRRNNRTDEETVARILANKQANWTVGPFFDEFIAEDEECALQSDDKYVIALGKLATIYNRNVDVVKHGFSVINRTNLDQSSTIEGNELYFPMELNVSCKNWDESREEDIKNFMRLSFAYDVVGKELLPDGVFQPADYQGNLNQGLFEKNSDIKISQVYEPCLET